MRKAVVSFTDDEITQMRRVRARQLKEFEDARIKAAAEHEVSKKERRLTQAMEDIKAAGFATLHDFQLAMLTTRDANRSLQITQMLQHHGKSFFGGMAKRAPEIAHDWMLSSVRQLVYAEATSLASHLRPAHHTSVADILGQFSIPQLIVDSASIAPTICDTASTRHAHYRTRRGITCVVISFLARCAEFQIPICCFTVIPYQSPWDQLPTGYVVSLIPTECWYRV